MDNWKAEGKLLQEELEINMYYYIHYKFKNSSIFEVIKEEYEEYVLQCKEENKSYVSWHKFVIDRAEILLL